MTTLANTQNFQIPPPPQDNSNASLHQYARDLNNFLTAIHLQGTQNTPFTQDQINAMQASNDPTLAGRSIFNSTSGKTNIINIDPNTQILDIVELS